MEALGATAACLQIGKTIYKLREVIKETRGASIEIEKILKEAEQICRLLSSVNGQYAALTHNIEPFQELLDIEEQCKEAANNLLNHMKVLEAKTQKSRWKGSVSYIFDKPTIESLRNSLESAKLSFMMAQTSYVRTQIEQQALSQMFNHMELKNMMQELTKTVPANPAALITTPDLQPQPISIAQCGPLTNCIFSNNGRTQRDRKDRKRKALICSITTPTRWLKWSLQFQAWRQFNEWTFNFRLWNYRSEDALIFVLARDGNADALRQLLQDKKGSVFDLDSSGNTALHYAAKGQQYETTKLLLQCGADVDRRTYISPNGCYRTICLNPQEYFLESLPNLSCGTAALSMAYAKRMMHLFTQYQCYDQFSDLTGFRFATYEWDDRYWKHDIYTDMTNLVFEPMKWLHHEFSLNERLDLCFDYPNWDSGMVLKWLGSGSIGNCPDYLYHYLARCMSYLFCMISDDYTRSKIRYAQSLQGWRKVLQELVALGDAANFGRSSVLKFLLSDSLDAEIPNGFVPARFLTLLTQSWIKELKLAGMLDEVLESFADHEHKHFIGSQIESFGCDCIFEITGLNSGPRPEDWCVYGRVGTLAFTQPNLSEIASKIPGSWVEDSNCKQELVEDKILRSQRHTSERPRPGAQTGLKRYTKSRYRQRGLRVACRKRTVTMLF